MLDPMPIVSLKPLIEIAAVPLLSFVVVMFILDALTTRQERALPSLFGRSRGGIKAAPAMETPVGRGHDPRELIRRAA